MRLAAALLVIGCAMGVGGCASPPTPPDTGVVVLQHRLEPAGGVFIEGAIAVLEIRDAGGDVVYGTRTPQYLHTLELGRAQLPPGDYEIRSYVQPCSGSCQQLDPPRDECILRFTLEAGHVREVQIGRGVGAPCRIS